MLGYYVRLALKSFSRNPGITALMVVAISRRRFSEIALVCVSFMPLISGFGLDWLRIPLASLYAGLDAREWGFALSAGVAYQIDNYAQNAAGTTVLTNTTVQVPSMEGNVQIGFAPGFTTSGYTLEFTAESISPVPIPPTYALLLSGIALIGLLGLRRGLAPFATAAR